MQVTLLKEDMANTRYTVIYLQRSMPYVFMTLFILSLIVFYYFHFMRIMVLLE